jgi:hypothetical protein
LSSRSHPTRRSFRPMWCSASTAPASVQRRATPTSHLPAIGLGNAGTGCRGAPGDGAE